MELELSKWDELYVKTEYKYMQLEWKENDLVHRWNTSSFENLNDIEKIEFYKKNKNLQNYININEKYKWIYDKLFNKDSYFKLKNTFNDNYDGLYFELNFNNIEIKDILTKTETDYSDFYIKINKNCSTDKSDQFVICINTVSLLNNIEKYFVNLFLSQMGELFVIKTPKRKLFSVKYTNNIEVKDTMYPYTFVIENVYLDHLDKNDIFKYLKYKMKKQTKSI